MWQLETECEFQKGKQEDRKRTVKRVLDSKKKREKSRADINIRLVWTFLCIKWIFKLILFPNRSKDEFRRYITRSLSSVELVLDSKEDAKQLTVDNDNMWSVDGCWRNNVLLHRGDLCSKKKPRRLSIHARIERFGFTLGYLLTDINKLSAPYVYVVVAAVAASQFSFYLLRVVCVWCRISRIP